MMPIHTVKPVKPLLAALAAVAMVMPATLFAQEDFAAGERTFETKIGRLDFNNGYATPDTSALLYDRMDFQRAVQVYLWSLPS